MISVQVSCWHWRETHWRPVESIKLCICAHVPHLGVVVISGGRQPLSSNSASQSAKQVFSITASPQKEFDVWWSTSQLLFCAYASIFSKACTQAMSRLMATYQGISRVCALGGSSWEGGTLQSKAALQFWHGHPLQAWRRASALSLPLEWGDFFLFRFELGLLWGPLEFRVVSLLRISRL